MISFETFKERLGDVQLPPPAEHVTLWRVLDEWCDAQAYTGQDGLTLVDEMLEGLAQKVWKGLVEVVEIEKKAVPVARKRKGPKV